MIIYEEKRNERLLFSSYVLFWIICSLLERTANKRSVPTALLSTTLGYDGLHRPITSSATKAGTSTSGSSLTDNQSFCYDAIGRLMWAGNSGTPTGGDHCGSTPGGSTTTSYAQAYSYDAIDRITTGPAGSITYSDPSHIRVVNHMC